MQAQDNARQRAITLEKQGQFPQAENVWRGVLKTHPSDAEAWAQIALIEAHEGRYKEAIPVYRKALALDPRMSGLRFDLALALFKDGELKQAIPILHQLLGKAPPGSPEAQRLTILLAMAHYGLAEYAQAAPLLKHAVAADPTNLPLRMVLAHSCLWSRQYQCVLSVYHEILALNAESAEADMLAGEAADAMKDGDRAIKLFQSAVKANPRLPNAHFGLGYLLWTRMKYKEAASEFEAELAFDPGQVQAVLYLGDSYMNLGMTEQAQATLEKAVRLDPSLWRAYLDLGILDAKAGHDEDALKQMRQAAKLNPNEVSVHWRLAQLDRKLGNDAEAKAEFAKTRTLVKSSDENVLQKMTGPHAPTPGRAPVLGEASR